MQKYLLFLACCFIFLSFVIDIQAQSNQSADPKNSIKLQSEEFKFLQEEIKNYRQFIETERKQHQEFVEGFYNKIFTLFWVIGGILVFLGIANIWQIRKTVNKLFQDHAINLIDKKNNQIKLSVEDTRKILDRETRYLQSRIVILGEDDDIKKLEDRELKLICSRGIKRNNLKITTDISDVSTAIENRDVDILLYYYNPTEQEIDPTLHDLIDLLNDSAKNVPVIIYNFEKGEKGRLYRQDTDKMVTYPYHLVANFPITLINHLYTTLNYIHT